MDSKKKVVGANRQANLAFTDELQDENIDFDGMQNFDVDVVSVIRRKSLSRRRSSLGMMGSKPIVLSDAEQARIASMYKTVIQMSSENKLNEKNSWSFDLIDHMGNLLKDEKRGVNFQKASCTLDASVKIYSNRVDDTYATSHRILESLSRNGPSADESEQSNEEAVSKKKAGSRLQSSRLNITATVEKNPENLNAAKLEHEYSFDPMFQKMSKAFDEGGAKGMLLYNMRVAPMSGSLAFQEKRIERDWTVLEMKTQAQARSAAINIKDLVDRSGLTIESVKALNISSKLQHYRKIVGIETEENGKGILPEFNSANLGASSDVFLQENVPLPNPTVDDCCENPDNYMDYDHDGDYDEDYKVDEEMISSRQSMLDPKLDTPPAQSRIRWSVAGDDIVRDEMEIQALSNALENVRIENNDEYAYFDLNELQQTGNSWAGAKHWNYPTRSKEKITDQKREQSEIPSSKVDDSLKTKKAKTDLTIKFSLDLVDESAFGVKDGKSTDSTVFSKAALQKIAEDSTDLLLPYDENLNVRDLCRLFSLPNRIVPPKNLKLKSKNARSVIDGYSRAQQVVDILSGYESIWSQQPGNTNVPFSSEVVDIVGGTDDRNWEDLDYDAPETANYDEPAEVTKPKLDGLNIDEANLVQAARMVEKIEISYAKVSKRVNVHKLKEDIWTEIRGSIQEVKPVKAKVSSKPLLKEDVSFQELVQDLSINPNQKDISVPYYFICLLHLANENTLKIIDKTDMSDLTISFDSSSNSL